MNKVYHVNQQGHLDYFVATNGVYSINQVNGSNSPYPFANDEAIFNIFKFGTENQLATIPEFGMVNSEEYTEIGRVEKMHFAIYPLADGELEITFTYGSTWNPTTLLDFKTNNSTADKISYNPLFFGSWNVELNHDSSLGTYCEKLVTISDKSLWVVFGVSGSVIAEFSFQIKYQAENPYPSKTEYTYYHVDGVVLSELNTGEASSIEIATRAINVATEANNKADAAMAKAESTKQVLDNVDIHGLISV